MTVGLATCGELPRLDPDDRLLPPALHALGIDGVPAVWDDPAVSWDAFGLVVVRNPWDYVRRRDEFLDWAARVPRLANPEPVLRWNTDKRYLSDLHAAGVPVVPTRFAAPHQDLVISVPRDGVVVKPAVSAGSLDTALHHEVRAALEHVARLQDTGRTAMVQPYLTRVEEAGETALLYVDGAFSHAIRKGPMLTGRPPDASGLFVTEDIAPREPSAQEREVADAVIAATTERFGAPLLYARVDLLPAPDGPVLLELELTDPSLFLAHADGAVERVAAAIAARL